MCWCRKGDLTPPLPGSLLRFGEKTRLSFVVLFLHDGFKVSEVTGYVVLGFFGRSLVGFFFSTGNGGFFFLLSFLHDLDYRAFRWIGERLFATLVYFDFLGPSCAVPWLPR